jgi:hypothetical protein
MLSLVLSCILNGQMDGQMDGRMCNQTHLIILQISHRPPPSMGYHWFGAPSFICPIDESAVWSATFAIFQ